MHFVKHILAPLAVTVSVLSSHAAETAAPPPGVLPDAAAVHVPLKWGSLSIFTENDKFFAGTDRNYTNGFKASVLSRDLITLSHADVIAPVKWFGAQAERLINAGNHAKIGLSFGQNIYTPTDIRTTVYQPDDRPYSAWLYVGAAFHNYEPPTTLASGTGTRAQLDVFEVNIGMVGPAALGRQIQNGFHDIIGVAHAEGWANQIGNEPGVNLIYERKWRFSSDERRDAWGADCIPRMGVSVGNVFTYANAGLELRAGWALPGDFGTSLIRASGDSNSDRTRFTIFAFVSTECRLVARDITLDGNTFRDSPSIDKKAFVYDYSGGIGIGTHWGQLTYTQARRSKEFKGQMDEQDFGSINISFFF